MEAVEWDSSYGTTMGTKAGLQGLKSCSLTVPLFTDLSTFSSRTMKPSPLVTTVMNCETQRHQAALLLNLC
jgi:hypothetical protein